MGALDYVDYEKMSDNKWPNYLRPNAMDLGNTDISDLIFAHLLRVG